MMDILFAALALMVVLLIFLRRWRFLETSSLFGRMVLKKGLNLHKKLTKEDHEITPKEMIPDASTIPARLRVKGENFFKKAEMELKKGNIEDAEKLYIKAIAMDASHVEAHAKLGAIYLNAEQFGKAELIYRKLVVAVSNDPVYFSNLGLALYHEEKYAEAKVFYEKAIELDPSRAGRFYSLSRIDHLLNDMDGAFQNIEKALLLDPGNLDYGLTLVHWQIEKDMYSDAKQVLENILKHWPDNEEAKKMLAEMNMEKAE